MSAEQLTKQPAIKRKIAGTILLLTNQSCLVNSVYFLHSCYLRCDYLDGETGRWNVYNL